VQPLLAVGIVMTLIGFAFKIAAAPFHLWAPDAYQGAPVPSAAFIASGSKVASFVVLGKIVLVGFAPMHGSADWHAMVAGWSLVARWLCAAMNDERLRVRRFNIIIPVPLHPARQRERGFNQATLLAELLSAKIPIQSKPLLERIRYTTTQTALDRAERMKIYMMPSVYEKTRTCEVCGCC